MLQMTASPSLPIPATYNDSIRQRIKLMRFKSVGHPFSHLDGVGIEAICEHITHGYTLLEVCEALDLPLSLVRKWVEVRGFETNIEEASILSAEGYLVEGMRMLRQAPDKFALDKAKAIVEQGRWMASKKDRKTYGQTAQELGQAAAVSYTFNIGGNGPVQINTAPSNAQAKDPKETDSSPTAFNVSFDQDPNDVPFDFSRPPDHLQDPHLRLMPVIAPLPESELDPELNAVASLKGIF